MGIERKLTILLVEDMEAHYFLVEAHLENSTLIEYEIDWAQDYDTALDLITRNNYDACVLDYDLGTRSGLDFIQEPAVKNKQFPIIFLTGRGNDEVDFKAMEQGVVDYLDKTRMHPNDLDRSIRYAVQRTKTLILEQEQRIFLEILISVINAANSTLDFDDVISRILDKIGEVVPYDVVDFMLVKDGYTRVTHCITGEFDYLFEQIIHTRFKVDDTRTFREMRKTQKPLLIPNVENYEGWIPHPEQDMKSYLGTPIFSGNDLIGFINLNALESNFFTEEHSQRLWILAQQTTMAIQNAQEYERAQEMAIIEERNRLARDLHDAVSQTLFSAKVIAESLPYLLEQDKGETFRALGRLSSLTKHALSEMRTLLIELHPSSLINDTLDSLLHQLADSILSEAELEYSIEARDVQKDIPDNIQITFYRIAQEAMNNIVKHARADHVTIQLNSEIDNMSLQITDDGRGFELSQNKPDHMGLNIMHERAIKANIELSINTRIDKGTTIIAIWEWGVDTAEPKIDVVDT